MASKEQSSYQYTQGYHDSVTRSHTSRTAEQDAAFLLPHLRPEMKILDVGCGPGTITGGFCRYVPNGSVTGVDISPVVLEQARSHAASQSLSNISFETGDILKGLPFPEASFDVVYCSQFLSHIPDVVAAMREMKRVCRVGGLVACREGDPPWRWYPQTEGLRLWNDLMLKMVFRGRERIYGSHMHAYARKAGFDPLLIQKMGSVTVYATPEERKWWGNLHAERIEKSDVGQKFNEVGATEEQLSTVVKALREWAENVDGWYGFSQCEIICKKDF